MNDAFVDKNWRDKLKWSSQAFHDLVWPILQKEIGGDLIHVEQITDESFAKDFDMLSGIDAWHIKRESGIRGIASRVQIPPEKEYLLKYWPYNTFTIRKTKKSGAKTEYQKRKEAIESKNGWIYPHLTVQAYISSQEGGELCSFAVAKTRDIIHQIDIGKSTVRPNWDAEFYCVEWSLDLCCFVYGVEIKKQPKIIQLFKNTNPNLLHEDDEPF